MPSKYESREDLAAKVDWEGGVSEAINGYGIGADELPEDTPADIVAAWRRVEIIGGDVEFIQEWLYA